MGSSFWEFNSAIKMIFLKTRLYHSDMTEAYIRHSLKKVGLSLKVYRL